MSKRRHDDSAGKVEVKSLLCAESNDCDTRFRERSIQKVSNENLASIESGLAGRWLFDARLTRTSTLLSPAWRCQMGME